jgi:glucose uptake protein GlcU
MPFRRDLAYHLTLHEPFFTVRSRYRHVKFALFYIDFAIGAWCTALIAFCTLGGFRAFRDSSHGGGSRVLAALLAGCLFNLANVLLVAGVAIAGLAVAFPVGIGLALVLGTLLTHLIDDQGHRADILFLGVFAAFVAILLQVMAYRHHAATRPNATIQRGGRSAIAVSDDVEILPATYSNSSSRREKAASKSTRASAGPDEIGASDGTSKDDNHSNDLEESAAVSRASRSTQKGLYVCLTSGVLMSLWSPLSAVSMALGPDGVHCEGCLTPYASSLIFCSAVLVSSVLICRMLMVRPLVGGTSSFAEYGRLYARDHIWGLLGGCLWATGTIANLISGAAMGLALSYAIGQAAPMVAVAWGIFYYREFVGADRITRALIGGMVMWYVAAILLTASSRS